MATTTTSCDYKLAADLAADCNSTSTGGVRNNGFIINYDDIDFDASARDANNKFILTNLVLQTGKKAYRMYVPGKSPFTGTNTALVDGTYKKKYTKTVSLVILDNGPDVIKDIIDPLGNGKFVIVLENKYAGKDGKNTFQVYGFEQGLSANALTDDKYSEETDGGWSATLEETGAPSPALYLFNESATITRTALNSLVNS